MLVLQAGVFGSLFGLLAALFWLLMPWVGLIALGVGLLFKLAPKLPWRLSRKVVRWHLAKAMAGMGQDVALVRTMDGHYTLAPARYDTENGILWIDYGDEEKGYDVDGIGQTSLPFFGSSLSLVYEDLGAIADMASAKLGRLAQFNYDEDLRELRAEDEDTISATDGEPDLPAVADGGEAEELGDHEVLMPTNGVVADLRNVMNLAPYHVRPSALKRVEKNAKAGLKGFADWGPVAQVGGMLAAFFMGGLLVYLAMGDSGGSGTAQRVTVDVIAPLAGVM